MEWEGGGGGGGGGGGHAPSLKEVSIGAYACHGIRLSVCSLAAQLPLVNSLPFPWLYIIVYCLPATLQEDLFL